MYLVTFDKVMKDGTIKKCSFQCENLESWFGFEENLCKVEPDVERAINFIVWEPYLV